MKYRFASALLALALPLCAQEPVADAAAEGVFYKAYYLEKGQRDYANAMVLYEEFLAKAPKHALAKEAAKNQFLLLDKTGKAKERDAFKEKYKDLLGNIADAPTRPQRGDEEGRGERGQRGQRGEGRGFGGRGNMRAMMTLMRGDSKIADMDEEQLKALKEGVDGATQMVDRIRDRNPETADKLDKAAASLKAALDAGKNEDAQKALDSVREIFGSMRGQRGGRGQRGDGGEGRGEGGEGRRRRREGGGGGNRPAGGGGGGGGGGGN